MAISIEIIRQEAYRLLNEATNSTLGQLPTGTGGTTITSDETVKTYILDAIANICRTCVLYQVQGSYSIANGQSSISIMAPSSITPTSSTMWYPTDVYIGSTRLSHASEQSVRANDLSYRLTGTTASTNILYWFRQDNYVLNVYPYNNTGASVTATVYGCGTPAVPATDATLAYSFLPDDLLRQMAGAYAATMLVMKNTDDPSVASRSFWKQFYDEHRMKLWSQLDRSLKAPGGPYSVPPVMGAGGK